MEDSKQYNIKMLHWSIGQESGFIQKLSKSLFGKSIFVLTQNSQKDGIIGVDAKQYMPFAHPLYFTMILKNAEAGQWMDSQMLLSV